MLRDLRRSYVSLSTCNMVYSQEASLLQTAQLLIGMHPPHIDIIMTEKAKTNLNVFNIDGRLLWNVVHPPLALLFLQ